MTAHAQISSGWNLSRKLFFVLLLLWPLSVLAQETLSPTGGEENLYRKAKEEQAARRDKMAKQLARQEKFGITQEMVDRARLEAETARLRQESVRAEQKILMHAVAERRQTIQNLEQERIGLGDKADPEEIARLLEFEASNRDSLERDETQLEEVRKWLGVYREERSLAEEWLNQLKARFHFQQERKLDAEYETLSQRLRTEMSVRQRDAERLRGEMNALAGVGVEAEAKREQLSVRILDLQERNHLARVLLTLNRLKAGSASFDYLLDAPRLASDDLEAAMRRANSLFDEAEEGARLLERKRQSIERYQKTGQPGSGSSGAVTSTSGAITSASGSSATSPVSTALSPSSGVLSIGPAPTVRSTSMRAESTVILDALLADFTLRSNELARASAELDQWREKLKKGYEQNLRTGLFVRLELPGDLESWSRLAQDIAMVPIVLLQRSWEILQELLTAMQRSDFNRFLTLIGFEVVWVLLYYGVHFLLGQAIRRAEATPVSSFSRSAILVAMKLVARNLAAVTLAGMPLIAAWQIGLSSRTLSVLLAALVPLLVAKAVINLAWFLLLSPYVSSDRHQPKLYRQIFWVTTLGGVLTAIVLLGHLAFFSESVRLISYRLFMLFVLMVLIPLKPIRTLLLERIKTRFNNPYWVQVISIFTLIVPLTVMAAVLLGLAGWLTLAGAVGVAIGLFLAVSAGWMVGNGLLEDLFQVLKRLALSHLSFGPMLIQGLLIPMHRLARLLLFFVAWVVLFDLYNWDAKSAPVRFLDMVFNSALFSLGSSVITVKTLIIIAVILAILVWMGHWSRQIAYRWLLVGIVDQGVRNSLATFSQYSLVLIGFLMALRYAGVDLTSLAVFAGALGVGIGFGLQNIASNFISGLLLLIERPLRNGDYVDLATQQGWVTRIGMRSLTLKNRDNLEVIIPNSDVITKPMVNWTHSDNVIRSIVFIGIHYDDDPRKAQRIIETAIAEQPEIMKTPLPKVWLWEFAASSVNFRVQYFTDMKRINENEIKSMLLYRIWDGFAQQGIRIPYPSQNLYVKELPTSTMVSLTKEEAAKEATE